MHGISNTEFTIPLRCVWLWTERSVVSNGMKFRIKTNPHTFVAFSLLVSFLTYITPTSNDKLP